MAKNAVSTARYADIAVKTVSSLMFGMAERTMAKISPKIATTPSEWDFASGTSYRMDTGVSKMNPLKATTPMTNMVRRLMVGMYCPNEPGPFLDKNF